GRADVPRGRDLSVQGAEQVAAGAGGAELRPPWRRGPVEVADAGVVEATDEEHRVSGLHGAGDGDGEVPGGDMRLGAGAECDGHSVPLSRAGQRTLGAWNSWTSCGRGWTRTRSALTRSTMSRPPPGTWRGSAGRSRPSGELWTCVTPRRQRQEGCRSPFVHFACSPCLTQTIRTTARRGVPR